MDTKGVSMVYLTILLTILISILIYTFDPAPNRSEHNISAAETYVLGFINQHQAARDFMQHWMGHSKSNTNSNKGVILSGDSEQRMENFMGYGLQSNAHEVVDSYFDVAKSGTFKSAYLCLDENLQLLKGDEDGECKNRYVVTYAEKRPSWWADKDNDAAMKQRWRRAIARRTRGSYGCGALTLPDEEGNGFWCYKTGVRSTLRATNSLHSDCDTGQRKEKYCIDTGEGCKSVLPKGIEMFLRSELKLDSDDKTGLSDTLVCISTVKNPYITDGLQFQYDGIDNSGQGAPASKLSPVEFNGTNSSSAYRKTPSVGGGVQWTEWLSGIPTDLPDASWANGEPAVISSTSGNVLRNGFHLGNDSSFTLTVVAQVTTTGTQTIIGPVEANGNNLPSLDVNSTTKKTSIALMYYSLCPVDIEKPDKGCFVLVTRGASEGEVFGNGVQYFKLNQEGEEESINDQVISWTLVKRPYLVREEEWSDDSLVYLYNGSNLAYGKDGKHVSPEYNGVDENQSVMTLGGDGNAVKIYAIRYYNRPLTRREIHHNFLVDVKRYGIVSGEKDYDNKFCETSFDCLNTYESCIKEPNALQGVCGVCILDSDCGNGERCSAGRCVKNSENNDEVGEEDET